MSSGQSKDVAKLKDVTVFNTSLTATYTWQDLDLSSFVGANCVLCFFEIYSDGATVFYMKPKGFGGAVANHVISGICAINMIASRYGYLLCCTDNNGILQIAANSDSDIITIKLVSKIK